MKSINSDPLYGQTPLLPPSSGGKIVRSDSVRQEVKFQDAIVAVGCAISFAVNARAGGLARHTVKFLTFAERLFLVKFNAMRFPAISPVVSRLNKIDTVVSVNRKTAEASKKLRDYVVADEKGWEKFLAGEGSMITGILSGSALSIALGDKKIKQYQANERKNETIKELKTMANELKLILNDEFKKKENLLKEKLIETDQAIAQLPPEQREILEREKNEELEKLSVKITDFCRDINQMIKKIDGIPLKDVDREMEENRVLCLKCAEPVILITLTLLSNRWSVAQRIYQAMQTSFPGLPERFAEKVIGGVIVVLASEFIKIANELDVRPEDANKVIEQMFSQMGLSREEIPQIESSDVHSGAVKVLTGAAGKFVAWAKGNPITGRLFKGGFDQIIKRADVEEYIERPLMQDEFDLLLDGGKKIIIDLMEEQKKQIELLGEGKEEIRILEKIKTKAQSLAEDAENNKKIAVIRDEENSISNISQQILRLFFPR